MLDSHVFTYNPFEIPPLWYNNGTYTEAYVLSAWDTLLQRFASKWNLFALDLKNEPHDEASWGMNRPWSDWNKAVERFVTYLANNNPTFKGFFFVEGLNNIVNIDSPNPTLFGCFWGECLMGVERNPIRTGDDSLDRRVVYSPHVYGPDVFNQNYFNDGNFPSNMPPIWDQHLGFVARMRSNPLVIGEWGGHYTAGSRDETWQNAFSSYMRANCLTDNFYWCLNPNGGDTGGLLLDDWTTPDMKKLTLLDSIQPYPSVIRPPSLGTYCIVPGTSPVCGG